MKNTPAQRLCTDMQYRTVSDVQAARFLRTIACIGHALCGACQGQVECPGSVRYQFHLLSFASSPKS